MPQFMKNTQSLRVIGNVCGDVKGNCRGTDKRISGVLMVDKENSKLLLRVELTEDDGFTFPTEAINLLVIIINTS